MAGIPDRCPECGEDLVPISPSGTGPEAGFDHVERVECMGDPKHTFPVLPVEGTDPPEYQLGEIEPLKDIYD